MTDIKPMTAEHKMPWSQYAGPYCCSVHHQQEGTASTSVMPAISAWTEAKTHAAALILLGRAMGIVKSERAVVTVQIDSNPTQRR